MKPHIAAILAPLLFTLASGCRPSNEGIPVYPVQGQILVDGKPVEGLQLKLHIREAEPTTPPAHTTGSTDSHGKVRFSTHAEGDGAPEGEYSVTILWQEFSMAERAYAGPDKLKNKYAAPEKTPVHLSVGPGQSNDLGTLDLTTQK